MKKFNAKVNAAIITSESFRNSIKEAVQLTDRELQFCDYSIYSPSFLGTVVTFNPNNNQVELFTHYDNVRLKDKEGVNKSISTKLNRINNTEEYTQNELIMYISQNELEYFGLSGNVSDQTREMNALKLENLFMTKYIEIVNSINEEDQSIDELELSIRSYNRLNRAGVKTVSQLKKLSILELTKVRNLGRRSIEEIETALGVKYDWSLLG